MTSSRPRNMFAAISECLTTAHCRPDAYFSVRIGKRMLRMSPEDAREALYGLGTDEALRNAVWHQAITEAQREKPGRGSETWRLLAIWLGLPGLYRTIHRIERRLATDRADLEGEAVLALLEAINTTDPESADPGSRIVKAAANHLWAYANRNRREVPVVDIAAVAAAYQARIPLEAEPTTAEGWELHITPPPRDEGLTATLRFTESRVQREGERLGALAQCAGLPHLAFRARRHANAARIGTLVLRSPEVER